MNNMVIILIGLLLFSCDDKPIIGISNEYIPSLNYSLNLDWDNSQPRSITEVHIKWNQWEENDSTNFASYYIKDVTTENDKDLEYIVNSEDTTYAVSFPTGTFLKICVLANFINTESSSSDHISSDTIQFFTQPMSPVSNILVGTQPFQHNITWNASSEDNITGLVLYRSYIEENDNTPNLIINPSNGLPEENEWQWNILYQGDNFDTSFVDTITILSDYKYFYSIKVQIEDSDNIENYRYSLIIPAVAEMINPISDHLFNLNASEDYEDVITLEWDIYPHDDFYTYEVWRSDVATTSTETLEGDGEKLVEITNKNLDYFEDRFLIGSGKKWYYFIKVYNNYGEDIESVVTQGDTRL